MRFRFLRIVRELEAVISGAYFTYESVPHLIVDALQESELIRKT